MIKSHEVPNHTPTEAKVSALIGRMTSLDGVISIKRKDMIFAIAGYSNGSSKTTTTAKDHFPLSSR